MAITECGAVLRQEKSGYSNRQAPAGPVAVSLDGVQDRVRLCITEDEATYGILAEFDGIPAEAFDVELFGREIHIFLRRRLAVALWPSYHAT